MNVSWGVLDVGSLFHLKEKSISDMIVSIHSLEPTSTTLYGGGLGSP